MCIFLEWEGSSNRNAGRDQSVESGDECATPRMNLSMMTSSTGNIFRVTDHLCGEFTGHRWISRTNASDAELWFFFFDLRLNKRLGNNGDAGDMRRHRAHYDVAVMKIGIMPTEFKSVMAYDLGPIGFAMVASQCPTYSTWLGWLPSKPSFGLWRNASVIHVQNMHSVWLFFC